jgi:hypothetical protein
VPRDNSNYIIHFSHPANEWTEFTALSAFLCKIRLSRSRGTDLESRENSKEASSRRSVNRSHSTRDVLIQPGVTAAYCTTAHARKHRAQSKGCGGGSRGREGAGPRRPRGFPGTRLRNIETVLTHSRGTTLRADVGHCVQDGTRKYRGTFAPIARPSIRLFLRLTVLTRSARYTKFHARARSRARARALAHAFDRSMIGSRLVKLCRKVVLTLAYRSRVDV